MARTTARIIVRDPESSDPEWAIETRNARDPRLADRARKYDADPTVELLGVRIGIVDRLWSPDEVEHLQAAADELDVIEATP